MEINIKVWTQSTYYIATSVIYLILQEEWMYFSGEVTLSKLFCLPSEMGSTLKGKHLLKFFSFRVTPFQKALGVQENKQ